MRLVAWAFASGLIIFQAPTAVGGSNPRGSGPDLAIEIAQGADACAATDDALAAQALKASVKRNPPSGIPGQCSWRSLGTAGDALTVQIDEGGEGKYDFDHSKLPVRDLQGVGGKAFAFVSPAGFVQIGMMSAGSYVTIVLMLQNGSDRLQRASDLAKAIAARMGG
ncbi:MAG TPA: hypothetical protein VKU84_11800 [Stellaceae bacterium]|nr:hypothetical protein [Stellaceae bacterium]